MWRLSALGLKYTRKMKGLVVLATVLTLTSAQVVFPDEDPPSGPVSFPSNTESNSGRNINSNGATSQQVTTVAPLQPARGLSCNLGGKTGTCMSLNQCTAFSQLAANLNDKNVLDYIRQRICSTGGQIEICCPAGGGVIPHNAITQPQTTRRPAQTTRRPTQTTRRPTTSPQVTLESQNPHFPTDCGTSFTDRIIGGTEIGVGAYPWLVAIGRRTRTSFRAECGGSLITNKHIISAAHCFDGFFSPTHVLIGEHNLKSDNDGAHPITGVITKVKEDNYDFRNNHNDIVILTLKDEVAFTSNIQPICLPFRADLRNNGFEGNHLDIVGWGRTNNSNDKTSDVPLEAKVQVVSLDTCKQLYSKSSPVFPIIHKQLCAGTGGIDSCSGDSGGPIHYRDRQTGRYYLAGVTSFGVECGRPDFPGVYTRVGSYVDWIESVVSADPPRG